MKYILEGGKLMEEIKDNDEVKFSDKQINALERILNSDVRLLIIKEIKNNYIPRSLPEEILKIAKKQKEELSERHLEKRLFLDGCIYALEEILKPIKEGQDV